MTLLNYFKEDRFVIVGVRSFYSLALGKEVSVFHMSLKRIEVDISPKEQNRN